MTKKYHRRRHLKGGFLDSLGQTFSNWGSSISQGASSVWNKTKKATGMDNTSSYSSSYTPSTPSSYTPSTPSSYTPSTVPTNSTSSSNYSYGGKRVRKSTRKIKRARTMKRGGNFSYNTPIDTLASRAGDYSRGLTARVNDLVGGKRRRKSRRR
jgi:hypothetical protein